MSKQKVTFWIEEGEVELLKLLFNTDNQSEAIRLAMLQSLATGDWEKVRKSDPPHRRERTGERVYAGCVRKRSGSACRGKDLQL